MQWLLPAPLLLLLLLLSCYSERVLARRPRSLAGQGSVFADPPSMNPTNLTMAYHGGALLGTPDPVNVYLLYYGNWNTSSGLTQQHLFSTLLLSLDGDSGAVGAPPGVASARDWWGIVSQYYELDPSGIKVTVSPKLKLAGTVYDKYSQGKRWTSDSIGTWNAVLNSLNRRRLPVDANGVYVVLPSIDVSIHESCDAFCGWHSAADFNGVQIVFMLILDAALCPDACGHDVSSAPGRTGAMDGTIETLAHELAESVTNPDSTTGWFTDDLPPTADTEIGDLCPSYGTILSADNGVHQYNVLGVNGTPFMLPMLFSWVYQRCELQAIAPAPGMPAMVPVSSLDPQSDLFPSVPPVASVVHMPPIVGAPISNSTLAGSASFGVQTWWFFIWSVLSLTLTM